MAFIRLGGWLPSGFTYIRLCHLGFLKFECSFFQVECHIQVSPLYFSLLLQLLLGSCFEIFCKCVSCCFLFSWCAFHYCKSVISVQAKIFTKHNNLTCLCTLQIPWSHQICCRCLLWSFSSPKYHFLIIILFLEWKINYVSFYTGYCGVLEAEV